MRLSTLHVTCLLGLAALLAFPATTRAQVPEYTETQTRELSTITSDRDGFVDSYAKGNVDGIMSAYHPDATFGGTLQPFWLEGEVAVRDLWQRYFGAWTQRHLKFRQPIVRFYADSVSVETGYMEMFMAEETKGAVNTYIRYSITRAKGEKGWQIVNMHVSRLPGT